MLECVNCHETTKRLDARFCRECGKPFKRCDSCKALIEDNAKFCYSCGHHLDLSPQTTVLNDSREAADATRPRLPNTASKVVFPPAGSAKPVEPIPQRRGAGRSRRRAALYAAVAIVLAAALVLSGGLLQAGRLSGTLSRQIAEKTREVNELEARYALRRSEFEKLAVKNKELDQKNEGLVQEVADREKELRQLEAQIAVADRRIKGLRLELARLEPQLGGLKAQIAGAETELRVLVAKNQKGKRQNRSLNNQIAVKRHVLTGLIAQELAIQNSISEKRAELAQVESKFNVLKRQYDARRKTGGGGQRGRSAG